MNRLLKRVVDHRAESTLATAFRRRRFSLFLSLAATFSPPVSVLDVGGEQVFWELMGLGGDEAFHITILNLYRPETSFPNITGLAGDARDLGQFRSRQFDIVFSNSVIEHLGDFTAQLQMAAAIQRVGRALFVQTPNRYFPLEPHFLVPFFQFFPLSLQVALVRRFNLGWYQRIEDSDKARQHVLSHRLLTGREMRLLFPNGQIHPEKVFGLTKSWISCGRVPINS